MKILAVDLGLARTGLAISDPTGFLASPIGTVAEKRMDVLLDKVAAVVEEHKPDRIVVGHPRNMDGSCGESAKRAEQFSTDLAKKTGVDTVLWDERLTTTTAIGYLNTADVRGKKRKAVVDTVAATVILQNYLDSLK